MRIVDLTRPFEGMQSKLKKVALKSDSTQYTGMVYGINYESMMTTYLDLPGHIAETDDGQTAANVDMADYYRQPATILRPIYDPKTGAVNALDLARAAEDKKLHEILLIHALGELDDHQIPNRSVYLTMDAVDWVIAQGCRILVSDIWESTRLDGVFLKFFESGVSAVCNLVKLDQLPDQEVKLSIIFLPYPGVTQIPCRVLAEF